MDYKLVITRQDTSTRVIDSGSKERCLEQLNRHIFELGSAAYLVGYRFEEMKTYHDFVEITGAVVLFNGEKIVFTIVK